MGGEVLDEPQLLLTKLLRLEAAVEDKEVSLKSKELELQTVTELSNATRLAAARSRDETLELARAVVGAQSAARRKQRETEALAAELAMFKASAVGFGEICEKIQSALRVATDNTQKGLPPDEDAARDWMRVARWDAAARERREKENERDENGDENEPYQNENENASSRPNAYLPNNLHHGGASIPFGENGPFKPGKSREARGR